ncbi:MAG TPA: SPFH domain-containing protein [Candidatus Acidoferrales bacterium]|nr:SPFH domain-containing protein [Candidatus Acidoferrales bacterium]
MLFLKYLLLFIGIGSFAAAAAVAAFDAFFKYDLGRFLRRAAAPDAAESASPRARPRFAAPAVIRWPLAGKFVAAGAAALLCSSSIVVVPDGEAGVRISQLSGVQPGALYAGTHLVTPLIDRIQLYDIRDRVFSTVAAEGSREKLEVLTVQGREGLSIGLAVTVRYRIDAGKLDYIQANLPQPVDAEIVEPVVTSVFRDLAPNYDVRDIFSAKRAEFRDRAARTITQKLAPDSILVKEVMLRKIQLPGEYARGLEGLLEKEQQDDQTSVEVQIQQKMVKISESQGESARIREVKKAEADGQSRVIMAKADSDAMQYTLPLKQKQIEQSRLEAEARKEAIIQNAEAEAQAKVIDSKAEQQRDELLAEAEANRIRVTSKANAAQLELEAAALKSNPLLVQYTVAQKLSDKVQIMLVPNDGKFFFTNDVLRSAMAGEAPGAGDPPSDAAKR